MVICCERGSSSSQELHKWLNDVRIRELLVSATIGHSYALVMKHMACMLRSYNLCCRLFAAPLSSSSRSLWQAKSGRAMTICFCSSSLCMTRLYEHSNAFSPIEPNAYACTSAQKGTYAFTRGATAACADERSSTDGETMMCEPVDRLHHLTGSHPAPPPHPANYVPPEQRDANDKSLSFWSQKPARVDITSQKETESSDTSSSPHTSVSCGNNRSTNRCSTVGACAPMSEKNEMCKAGDERWKSPGLGAAGSLYAGESFYSTRPVMDGGDYMLDYLDKANDYCCDDKSRHAVSSPASIRRRWPNPSWAGVPLSAAHTRSQPSATRQYTYPQAAAVGVSDIDENSANNNTSNIAQLAMSKQQQQQRWTPRARNTHVTDVAGSAVDRTSADAATAGATFYDDLRHRMEQTGSSNDSMNRKNCDATAAQNKWSKELERDFAKLEYYQGTSKYTDLVKEFGAKHGSFLAHDQVRSTRDAYSQKEHNQGLTNEPVDYDRSSKTLKLMLKSGPLGYSPFSVLQQHGLMGYRGNTFPASTQLGKLCGMDTVKSDVHGRSDGDTLSSSTMTSYNALQGSGLVSLMRYGMNTLLGRADTEDRYLSAQSSLKHDSHVLYRVFGVDAIQRKQLRRMLTDFDYADRNIAFHVMMSYPYTDWLHAFYMVLIGCLLYQCQLGCHAYEFYDEYLGLDLSQVPSLKKPAIACLTFFFMVYFMFQPLLVASIATTRAYRIVMRRPIGPP